MDWWIATIGIAVLLAVVAGMQIDALRTRVRKYCRNLSRWVHELSLLAAVTFAVLGGVGIVGLATWILRHLIHTTTKEADPVDVTKLSFTVAAGVGAAVALVVAYRRQRDVEQGRFVERFGAAAAQLGDHDVAVRIAGVYAMAGVADESAGLRRQQCIDVLCGYLRLPYSPELGSNHQSKLVITEPVADDDGTPIGEQERHLEFRQNDKEVRATIVRVIADHLRNHEYSWSACDFDFRTAHMENVDFRGTVLGGSARFDRAAFSGGARFDGAVFSGLATFDRTTFSGGARFDGAVFPGYTTFAEASFSNAATFRTARFSGEAGFEEVVFSGIARFDNATFAGEVAFDGATFSSTATFGRTTFSSTATFGDTAFSGDAWFGKAVFAGDAWFEKVTFRRNASFDQSTFASEAWFGKATFSDTASFTKTDFGSRAISFANPLQWGPPPPVFDWNADFSKKPPNVTPENWPPTSGS